VPADPTVASIDQYISGVLTGEVIAGKSVKAAGQRHLDDQSRVGVDGWPYYFDGGAADEAVRFFSMLEHTTGSYDGVPFSLHPFQAFIISSIFGWKHSRTKLRRFRQSFVSMARGNGKSPLGAGVVLKCAVMDDPIEARAECYAVATKRKQAQIVFDEIRRFVERCEFLRDRIECLQWNLSVSANGSKIEPLSSEGKTADGLVPHVICVDELHAWKEEHRDLMEKLKTSLGKRDQPLLFIITTAGSDESDIWQEEYLAAKAVVERGNDTEDDRKFVFIAEIDDEDDELDEACWPKANPLLGAGVVKIDHLRTMATQAETDPAKRNEFRRYHCNKLTSSITKPITRAIWAECSGQLPDLYGLSCHAGFDWGWRDDLAALGFAFPLESVDVGGEEKQRYAIRADVWIPDEGRRDIRTQPFARFIADGSLTVTHGETTDTAAIYETLERRGEEYEIRSLAFDPHNCREFSTRALNEYGIDTAPFNQTCGRYNEPLREFVNALAEGRIVHGGDGLLGWAALNMAIHSDTRDYQMPSKRRSVDKIDPIVAIIMAIGEAMFAASQGGGGTYSGGAPVFI